MKKKVLLGLSGGVDSAVAALLLKRRDYKVIGAFMKNFSDVKDPLTGECNYLEDKKMAQKLCMRMRIPFIFIDSEEIYKKRIINPMIKSYKSGLTPNPDIACNSIVKFPILKEYARELKCDFIATGHYARIKKDKRGFHLLRGVDSKKDQSYFLSELTQDDLNNLILPIGDLKKEEVRKLARKSKLPNWNRESTSGICFVGNINMHSFLKERIKENPGKVILPDKREIGTHLGIAFYTMGQKALESKGIQIKKPRGMEQKRFYIAKKIRPNIIMVAPENHPILKKKYVILKSLHLINQESKFKKDLRARIRHLGELHEGTLTKKKGKLFFIFKKPVEGLAEGQYLVLYKKDELIGSGEIRF